MIDIGKYNELRILEKSATALILSDGTQEILLPYHDVLKDANIGDHVHVFVYKHKDGNLYATTKKPYACAGDFAYLKVADVTADGAFLDLGIGKDVFVPEQEQRKSMYKGESYVVYVYLDESNDRMLASSKLYNFIEEEGFDFEEGDEVSLMIVERTDLGYNAIINNKYIGLLYHNELFSDLQPGDERKGWIKKIRINNKIDLTLQPSGYGHILDSKDILLKDLRENGGIIHLGDKSTPDEIYARFKISKNAFRKTIGALYKERLITLSDYEIKLVIDQEAE